EGNGAQRQVVGLGAAGGHQDPAARHVQQRGDPDQGLVEHRAGASARGVHRRGVPPHRRGLEEGFACVRPQHRGRGVVEVGARLVPSSPPSRRSPRLDRVVLGLAGVLLAVAALRVAVALLELVVLLLLLGAALGGGLLVGPVALGVLAGRIPGVLLPGGPALVLAAGVGIVPGLLVGLAALLLDPLAVVLGGLGVLVAGAATALALALALAFALAASSAAGAGGEQLLGLEEAVRALLRVLDPVRLPLDGDREVVEDLALGVQRGVEVAVLRPLLQREQQLLLRGGVLALLQQGGALGQVRQVGLEPV